MTTIGFMFMAAFLSSIITWWMLRPCGSPSDGDSPTWVTLDKVKSLRAALAFFQQHPEENSCVVRRLQMDMAFWVMQLARRLNAELTPQTKEYAMTLLSNDISRSGIASQLRIWKLNTDDVLIREQMEVLAKELDHWYMPRW